MSDPAERRVLIQRLPGQVDALCRVIQGLLVHCDWLASYGLSEDPNLRDRRTLPLAERLRRVLEIDPSPLDRARPPASRSLATCRDFALMLVSFLRTKMVPARLRCGFAGYLGPGWEDHWVCEYWDARAGAWRLADPQIDEILRTELGIGFDPSDVPRSAFLTAGEAWRRVRAGELEAGRFGHGQTRGLWFMRINVARDHLALNGVEVSPWDDWRQATGKQRLANEADNAAFDLIAASAGRALWARSPEWTA